MQRKSKTIKQGADENEKRVASAYGKEVEDDTEVCKIKMSKMQTCNCKTMEV
jgi:hypothetical protein